MLTLEARIRFPPHAAFSFVGQEAFLLNTSSNQYFSLEEVGTRVWLLLQSGISLREAHTRLLAEYEVSAGELEKDILELAVELLEAGLIELVSE